eukprot:TRINITY_DN27928_c0_g1_i1.p1 TRINITY_DN27928_c0_g1~~TRINITY_DN27928_c0_g1_i1.p1  ORF type:complete len:158 (+),score=1.95 TRINITY_DN27928_c0_g1_i1:452-925(+)
MTDEWEPEPYTTWGEEIAVANAGDPTQRWTVWQLHQLLIEPRVPRAGARRRNARRKDAQPDIYTDSALPPSATDAGYVRGCRSAGKCDRGSSRTPSAARARAPCGQLTGRFALPGSRPLRQVASSGRLLSWLRILAALAMLPVTEELPGHGHQQRDG